MRLYNGLNYSSLYLLVIYNCCKSKCFLLSVYSILHYDVWMSNLSYAAPAQKIDFIGSFLNEYKRFYSFLGACQYICCFFQVAKKMQLALCGSNLRTLHELVKPRYLF